MRKFFIMMFGLLFVASTAFASPSVKGDIVTMNKADSQILFDISKESIDINDMDIIVLNSDEMTHTNAKGWFSRAWKRLTRYVNRHFYDYRTDRCFWCR
jgi:hypothetical protein